MRNRLRILVVIVLGALVLGAAFYLARPREPRYQGRSLSYWLKQWGSQGKPMTQEEERALSAIQSDPKVIPYLLKWIEEPSLDKPVPAGLFKALKHLKVRLVNHLEQSWRHRAYLPKKGAVYVLKVMGPQAAQAVPELERMLINTPDNQVRRYAALGLAQMGAPGLPALTAALSNASPGVRRAAINSLWVQGTDVYPILLKALQDQDSIVAVTAWDALRGLKADPELLVPPLIPWLNASNTPQQVWAVIRLKSLSYHKAAQSAVPALQAALIATNNQVRRFAADALRSIAPETLTNGAK